MLLETKLILLGAYLTHGTATDGTQRDGFYKELALRNSITHRLAAEFGAEFLDFQKIFNEACEMLSPEHWTQDDVHPTAAGHRLIANAWKKDAADANDCRKKRWNFRINRNIKRRDAHMNYANKAQS